MSRIERKYERVSGPLSADHMKALAADGWKLVGLTWEREVPQGKGAGLEPVIPFGLRVAEDCSGLAADPFEIEALMSMLEMIIQDRPLTEIAGELNRRGSTTRDGSPWNPATVFDLMPRLIEVGSQVFATPEWAERRKRLANV